MGEQKLDEIYSWEELGNKFADKIEETQFISRKTWNRQKFIWWFMEREKLGLRFDWRLIARAYIICKDYIRNEKDHFTVIVGHEGDGKSTLAAQFLAWIAPEMDINDICYNMPQYITRLQLIGKHYKKQKAEKINKSVLIDEGGINLFSRESLSTSNKVLAKTFMVQRFLNINVGICIPHYPSLDKMIRNHRINTLLIIKSRAYYKCVVGKGIKILNKLLKKDPDKDLISIPIPYGMFWEGNFRKDFPKTLNETEYKKHKFSHIKEFIEDAKHEASTVKMIKVIKLEKEFGINSRTIISEIHEGNIEGRKIGNQWFITKKAYEKLIMS
jgi:energy-coupling factor transporter ATP-binding protein EcfA2